MKILFDENLSYRIIRRISSTYPEAIHVDQTDLPDEPGDTLIWQWARDNNYAVVVSQDADFADLLDRYGPPPKVIHLRFGNQRIATIVDYFERKTLLFESFIADEELSLLEIHSLD